jgi:hypothetical protein
MQTQTPPQTFKPLKVAQAMAQLRFVWPGLMRRHLVKAQVREALEQVDAAFVESFRQEHPHARHAIIYRVGKHEVQLRDLHSGDLSVHWVDHPRLVGSGIAWGKFSFDIEQARAGLDRQTPVAV